jgi:DNA uptake protein ComE-like DNA-binding protein
MGRKNSTDSGTPGSVFKVGAIALAFLLIGYQSALFVHRAAELRIASLRDKPDTVYVVDEAVASRLLGVEERSENKTDRVVPDGAGVGSGGAVSIRRNAQHAAAVENVRRATRRVESFRFNPNTVSIEDLIRLGFSEKQAQAIDNYRAAGGRFRRPSDFARSYAVPDSVFERLRPFIDIPKTNINTADSAAFDALPGIGPYFAARMVSYRKQLGGYSYKEQLMDIHNFDRQKYDGLADLVSCPPPRDSFRLWQLPADSLRLHPYIRSWQAARSIVLFRQNTPPDGCTVSALAAAGILPPEDASRLERCLIAKAQAHGGL